MAFPFSWHRASVVGERFQPGTGGGTAEGRKQRQTLRKTKRGAQGRRKVLMESLEPRLLLAADLAVLDDGGLNEYFDEVQRQLDNDVFSAPIPLIGTQLAEKQAGRIADRISLALDSFTIIPTGGITGDQTTADDVVNALTGSLGTFLQSDILDTTTPDNSEYRFALTLGGSESERIDLDLALGEDPLIDAKLGVADEVMLSFDWTFDLTFGVFENDFGTSLFFVDTAASDELQLNNILAVLDGGDDGELDAKGVAGVFTALIQEDSDGAASQFAGSMDVDVAGGGGDQRLTRFEIPDLELDAVVDGNADISLDIDAALYPEFTDVAASERVFNLAVEADASIQQSFVNANTKDTQFGNAITIDYESVRLDLGTFFSEFVDPTVEALQDALDPLKVPVDFLTAAIPVLSDIGQVVGLGKVTPIDLGILATTIDPDIPEAEKKKRLNNLGKAKLTLEFLNLFFDLGPIGEGLPDTSELGGFKVQLTEEGKEDNPDDDDDGNGDGEETDGKKKVEVTESNPNTGAKDEVENTTETSSDFFSTVSGSLAFPFLQDTTLVHDMLLGDTTPVLANFGIDFEIGYVFKVTIPIIAPFLNAEFRFDFGATLDFDAGYDLFGANALTRSLDFSSDEALDQSIEDNKHRLADGFFLDDHFPEDAPADLQDGDVDPTDPIFDLSPRDPAKEKPELTVTAKLSAGAKVGPDLVVAEFSAGVRVFFATDLLFDLNDLPDPQNDEQFDYVNKLRNGEFTEVPTGDFTYDGRVRIGELDLITRADPFGIFNYSGALRAGLEAFVFASIGFSPFEIVIVDKTFELVNEVIYDFDIFQLPDEDVLAGIILNPPTIGAVDTNGTLTLFMGDTADQRVNTGPGRQGVDNEINEGFSISSLGLTDPDNPAGGETLLVKFLVFEDGERVERVQQRFEGVTNIVAAGGSGNDQIVVDDEVLASVDFSGGSGDDVLSYAGSGVALLRGDNGDDRLIGGSNDDNLQGGIGNDDLVGGDGNDTLDGGANDDRLDGGLGDDENIGGTGSDTFVWAPGQGADVFLEDPGPAGDDNSDRLTVGGSFELTEGAYESGVIGAIEAGDNITLSKVLDAGALKVLLETSDGSGPTQSLLIDNIENISIAAGGGSDVVTLGDLTGTDVSLLAIDLSAPEESSPAGETDRVVFSGSELADNLTVQGVIADFDTTTFSEDGEDDVTGEISKEIIQLRDQSPGRDSRAFIINSTPEKDFLEVRGLGGDDELEILANSDDNIDENIDVSDLIDVTLDGGAGNDTLISAFDNATLIGGGGMDSLIIRSDGKVIDGTTSMQLFEEDLLISRVEDGVGPVNDRLSFSDIESLRIELEPATAGNTLRVVSSIAGDLEIQGSTFNDTILLETLAGLTTVDLNGGDNNVVVGKDGSLGGILGDLQILGGTGSDQLTFDESASADDTLAQIGVLAVLGLSAPGALRYDNAVETVELRLGLGADEVEIADLTRRVIVDAGGGDDSVQATLFGTPLGTLLAPGLITFNAEQVDFANDNNFGDTDWLLTNDQLRAGTPGIFDPLVPGFYDQMVLETTGADQVDIALGDGPGVDRLLVWDVATSTEFELRGGDDEVIVGDSRDGAERALINIQAPLSLLSGDGTDTLTIDDRANTISDSPGFIDVGSITGFAMGVEGRIDFASFASLDITLADTDDDVTLVDTAIETTIRTDATDNSGEDSLVILNATAGATIELRGESDRVTVLGGSGLNIDGGNISGADTIVFDISDVTTPTSGAELGQSNGSGLLTNLGPIGDVTFDGFEEAQIELGQNSDAISVNNSLNDLTVKIDGAAGDDTVTIHEIGGATQITGESGLDRVVVEIPGDPSAPQHANLFENLRVDVESLVVDNEDNASGVDWLVSSGVLSGNGVDLLFTDGAEEIRILGGSADDSLDFEELARPVDATIDGQSVVLQLGDVVLQSSGFGTFANFSNVVDFDALVDGASDQYTEDGFTLATSGTAILRDDSLSAAAKVQSADDVFTLTEENDGAFALYSISLAALTPGDKEVTFTGTTLVGDTVTRSFTVEGESGFAVFDLPSNFTSLRDVSWSAVNVSDGSAASDEILVDNIIGASLVPVGTPAATPGDFPTYILSGTVTFNTSNSRLWGGSIGIDLDGDLIADDFISAFSSNAFAASKGMFASGIGNGITQFRFAGDVLINDNATVRATGSNALSLFAGNNAYIDPGARFDVSANGRVAGSGGGNGGFSGSGGEGGFGLGGGGSTQNEVGQEGTFLGEGQAGSDGFEGSNGEAGDPGTPGTGGTGGVNGGIGGSGGAGGSGGTAGIGGGEGEGGEGGGEGGGGGGTGGAGGGGDAGRAGLPGQNNGSGSLISGGGGGGGGGHGGGGGEGGGGGSGGSGGGGDTGAGGRGGGGGAGGSGGNGGDAGEGGTGGGGGGAIEVSAQGRLVVESTASFFARGGDGRAPVAGDGGSGGGAFQEGGSNTESGMGQDGGGINADGGAGGDGGRGGAGGSGGYGGAGAGGAGGTVKLSGSVVDAEGISVDTSGGEGAADPRVSIFGNSLSTFYWDINGNFLGSTNSTSVFEGNGSGNFFGLTPSDNFLVSWLGNIEVTGNQDVTVNFQLGSDDGSRLRIGGTSLSTPILIDNWRDQGFNVQTGSFTFSPGLTPFRVDFYERGGFAGISLTYSIFGGPQQLLTVSPGAEDGRFIFESNVAGGRPEPGNVTAQSSLTFEGPTEINPFIEGAATETPLIADLAGGAEGYGLLQDIGDFDSFLDDISSQLVGLETLDNAPSDALAAVVRLDVGPTGYADDYSNHDMLLFINLSDQALDDPELGIVGNPASGFSTDLLTGGFMTDALFGGSGSPQALDALGVGQIWATLIPDSNPGGLATDFINASVNGTILGAEGEGLRDGESFFITAPRPVVSNAAELSGLQGVAVSPDGQTLYGINTAERALVVANAGDLGQRQFFQDGIDGVDGLDGASAVIVSADGESVYVTGSDDGEIAQFDRDPTTGDLTFVGTFTAAGGLDVYDTVATSGDGNTVVIGGDDGVVVLDRAADGSLSQADARNIGDVTDVAVSDDGGDLYAIDSTAGTLIGADATDLSQPLQTIDLAALGVGGASAVTISADGAFVYAVGEAGGLAVFTRDATGTLTFLQDLQEDVEGIRGLAGANDVAASSDNGFVYVTGGSGDSLAVFERNATTGELQFAQVLRGREGLESPSGLATGADGSVYVSSNDGLGLTNGGVAAFSRLASTGETPPLVVEHQGIEELSLRFGGGDDVISQINAASVNELTIDAGNGFNTVDLLNLGPSTSVHTAAGDDEVSVRSDTPGALTLNIETGAGEDTVVVRELVSGNAFTIDLGENDDTIQIAGEALPASASIALDGGSENDILLFSAGGLPIAPAVPVTPNGTIKVNGAAFGTVTYQSIEAIPGFEPSASDAGGPYQINEGDGLQLNGTATPATNTTIVSTRWDLNGDGDFSDVETVAPLLSWADLVALGIDDDGLFEISLEVTDSVANVAINTGLLTILNALPEITTGGATAAVVGTPYVLTFSATDPGDDTITRWEVDWGDGSPREVFASDATSASHVYLTTGSFTPIVVATDEDGTGSFAGDPAATPYTEAGPTVTVTPPTPSITTVGTDTALQISEGEGVTLQAVVAGTPTSITWDLDGDGAFGDEASFGTVNGAEITLTAAELESLGLDDGTADYSIGVQVAFGSGAGGLGVDTAVSTAALTVLNAAPSAQLGNSTELPAGPVNEGESATVTISNQSDPSASDEAAGFTYSYDFDNDGVFEIENTTDASVVVPGAFLNDAGTQTVRAVITDKDGGSTELFTGVRVAEVAPTLNVVGADTAIEGQDYDLDLSATDPGDDSIASWTVDWGDGSGVTVLDSVADLTHVFADSGEFTVTITAQDEDGLYVVEKTVTVANVAPTITISGPATIEEGEGYILDLSASDPGDDVIASWTIDWGDGSDSVVVPGSSDSVSHIYADDSAGGTFGITVTATDEDGSYVETTQVTVENVAPVTALSGIGTPTAQLAGPEPTNGAVAVNEGSNFILQIAAPSDPGDDTVTQYSIDWGDGSPLEIVAAPEADENGFIPTLDVVHIYDDGDVTRTITVTLTDEDGSFVNDTTLDADVRNVAPSLEVTGNASVDEGQVYSLTLGDPTDPGDDTVQEFIVDWGDGSPVETFTASGVVTHVYGNDSGGSDVTISIDLVDEDGLFEEVTTKIVTVNVVPASLEISGAPTAVEGTPYTLNLGDLVDPGSDSGVIPVLEYIVDWGDGAVESFTAAGPVTHSFADGLFNNLISVDVVTAEGTIENAASLAVQIANAAPEITSLSISEAPLPDLNGDNIIDVFDISIVASSFGADPASDPRAAAADLNGDGMIDMTDINIVLGAFGQSVPPPPPADGSPTTFASGGTAIIEGSFSDLGVADSHEVLIDWGDGTTTVASVTQGNGEGSFSGRHTYNGAGVYKVTVTAADNDGADSEAVETVAFVTGTAVRDGVLQIVGTGADDSIMITRNLSDPTRDQVDIAANFLGSGGGSQTIDVTGLTGAVVYAGGGNDSVSVADGIALPFLVMGGEGNDTLSSQAASSVILGGAGNDELEGGDGSDILIGGAGEDGLSGGAGNDLLVGGEGNDALDGGADDDVAFYNGEAADYSVTPGPGGTTVTSVDPLLDGDDTLVDVEDIIFEDGDDDISPVTNPWAEDVIARLKGPAKDISARDATWLLFD